MLFTCRWLIAIGQLAAGVDYSSRLVYAALLVDGYPRHRPGNTLPPCYCRRSPSYLAHCIALWCTINRDTIARYCLTVAAVSTGKNRAGHDVATRYYYWVQSVDVVIRRKKRRKNKKELDATLFVN